MTINIKEAQHPLKREKQVIDKSSIMLKISTKSMHRVLVYVTILIETWVMGRMYYLPTALCFALVKSIGLIGLREYVGIYGLDKGIWSE